MESNMDPKNEGWRLEDVSLVPVMTDEEFSLNELPQIIRSSCRVTSKTLCSENSVLTTLMGVGV